MHMTLRHIILVSLLMLTRGGAAAQTVNGRFSTSFYAWEKFATVNVSKVVPRAFQTLRLDISQEDVSLQSSITGAMDLGSTFGNDGRIRVNNLFLRWKNMGGHVEMNLGRTPVFAGVGVGGIDGVMLKARGFDDHIVLVTYGGANVRNDLKSNGTTALDQNFMIGGQLVGMASNGSRISASYVNRHVERESYTAIRPDSLFNPASVLIVPDSRSRQIFGVDARYAGSNIVSLYGRYDYDINLQRSLRTELNARVKAMSTLAVSGSFTYREPNLMYNSFFTIFPVSPIREYEGGIEYAFSRVLRCFGRVAYVQYTDDASRRVSVGFNTDYGSVSYSGTNGYAGQLSSLDIFAMYPIHNYLLVPSVGFSFASYRLEENFAPKKETYATIIGLVIRPMPALSFDSQVQVLRNPEASRDLRWFGKITYWFNHTLDLL